MDLEHRLSTAHGNELDEDQNANTTTSSSSNHRPHSKSNQKAPGRSKSAPTKNRSKPNLSPSPQRISSPKAKSTEQIFFPQTNEREMMRITRQSKVTEKIRKAVMDTFEYKEDKLYVIYRISFAVLIELLLHLGNQKLDLRLWRHLPTQTIIRITCRVIRILLRVTHQRLADLAPQTAMIRGKRQ